MVLNMISASILERDISTELQQQVQSSIDLHSPILIRGGNSKAFYGRRVANTSNIIDLKNHTGILDYDPAELAITVRAGTRLQDLERLLDEHQQMLAFEPPVFSEHSTIGGVVAAGMSGPRRAFSGSIRDAILGVEIINGDGNIVQFGGQVMKNVAGYDMSRLMVRSMGTLGVILSLSLRVIPKPAKEITLVFDSTQEESLTYCKQWRNQHLPISATSWCRGKVYLRLSGSDITLAVAQQKLSQQINVEEMEEGEVFWQSIRNQTHDFFTAINKPLWRLSLPINTPVIARFEGELLTEWGGTQRWVSNNAPANIIRAVVKRHKGYATLFNAQQHLPEVPPFPILVPELLVLHKNLKRKLDPHNIFNPGRIYRDL